MIERIGLTKNERGLRRGTVVFSRKNGVFELRIFFLREMPGSRGATCVTRFSLLEGRGVVIVLLAIYQWVADLPNCMGSRKGGDRRDVTRHSSAKGANACPVSTAHGFESAKSYLLSGGLR